MAELGLTAGRAAARRLTETESVPGLTAASLFHTPDSPFAYQIRPRTLRVVLRGPARGIGEAHVVFNDRYAWEGSAYAPLLHRTPLRPYARDGEVAYWSADLELEPPRFRYRFELGGPDERRWLGWDGLRDEPRPAGSFEFGYVHDGDAHDLPAWAEGAVFYQIFPERFARGSSSPEQPELAAWDTPASRRNFLGGDLDGIREKLDYVASLSVDAIYLNPVFDAPSNHKYDTRDYLSVDAAFGGNAALRRMVDEAHRRGIRVVLDGVFNHSGSEWPPFREAMERGAEADHARWFYLRSPGPGAAFETWANDVKTLPKLRTSEPDLAALIADIGRFWVAEYGIDGWRLDVANEVNHDVWRRFRRAVRGANREALLIGEIWTPAANWLRGDQLDSAMNYPLRQAMHDYVGGSVDGRAFLDTVDRLRASYPQTVHNYLYNLIGSHDVMRPLTAFGGDRRRMALATALLFTLPGIASVYYGDEVGMEGDNDPACRDGMQWDETRQDGRMLAVHQRLGRLRRENPALRRGAYERLYEDETIVAFARASEDRRVVVVANRSPSPVGIPHEASREWLAREDAPLETIGYDGKRAGTTTDGLQLPAFSLVLFDA